MIKIYSQNTTDFNNNGLGILRDTLNAKVIEELNGTYELNMSYPIKGWLIENIVSGNIIKLPCGHISGNEQLFRIKIISRTLTTIDITAFHIFYDLADYFLEDVYPTSQSGAGALSWILGHTTELNTYTSLCDIPDTKSARYVDKNVVESLIGNIDNSFVKKWGGELVRDNYLVNFKQSRGLDRGVKLLYGKNMQAIKWDVDMTNIATRIYPKGADGLVLPEKYIDSSLINNYDHKYIKTLNCSDIKIDENTTEAMAISQLRTRVNEAYQSGADIPIINITVDFIELAKIEEYKAKYSSLETIYLGDTVQAIISELNATLKIVKVTYDCLYERNESFEIGDVQTNYVEQQIQIKAKLEQNSLNLLQEAKNSATIQLNTALGGYIYKTQSELFIMDTDNIATAVKVWRWNLNGLGYSSTGINGPYGLAMTQDGQIVADFITTGTMSVARITGLAGQLSSIDLGMKDINFSIKSIGGNNLVKNSVMKNGTRYWLKQLNYVYLESDTAPTENLVESAFWYCSSSYSIYRLGVIYQYTSGVWVETNQTRKILENVSNLLQWTSSYSNDYSKKYTISDSLMRFDAKEIGTTTHIFNVSNMIHLVEGEETLTVSFKISNHLKTGVGAVILGFLNKTIEELPLEVTNSIYEPSYLFTPDECIDIGNGMTQVVMNIKVPKVSDILPAHVSLTAPIDTSKLWLDLNTYLVKIYNEDSDSWEYRKSDKSVYNEDTKFIWTYRELFGFFYQTTISFTGLEIKTAYGIFVAYSEMIRMVPAASAPTPFRGAYWLKTDDNIFRAKYQYNTTTKAWDFNEWFDTGIPSLYIYANPQPSPPYPTPYLVPISGYYEASDFKIEYNTIATAWSAHTDEIYSKNFKMDSKGMQIISGENVMYIDEDEIVAKFQGNDVFRISGEDTFFKKLLLVEKLTIGTFVHETIIINGIEYELDY